MSFPKARLRSVSLDGCKHETCEYRPAWALRARAGSSGRSSAAPSDAGGSSRAGGPLTNGKSPQGQPAAPRPAGLRILPSGGRAVYGSCSLSNTGGVRGGKKTAEESDLVSAKRVAEGSAKCVCAASRHTKIHEGPIPVQEE